MEKLMRFIAKLIQSEHPVVRTVTAVLGIRG